MKVMKPSNKKTKRSGFLQKSIIQTLTTQVTLINFEYQCLVKHYCRQIITEVYCFP